LVCLSRSTPEEVEFDYQGLLDLMNDPEIKRQRKIIEDADRDGS